MRAFAILVLGLACAAPAAAQDYLGLTLQRDAEFAAQAELFRQREVALSNQLAALEARLQTDQALRDIEALRHRPSLPTPADPKAPSPTFDPKAFASIPDGALAASNARVRAAAQNRR